MNFLSSVSSVQYACIVYSRTDEHFLRDTQQFRKVFPNSITKSMKALGPDVFTLVIRVFASLFRFVTFAI